MLANLSIAFKKASKDVYLVGLKYYRSLKSKIFKKEMKEPEKLPIIVHKINLQESLSNIIEESDDDSI